MSEREIYELSQESMRAARNQRRPWDGWLAGVMTVLIAFLFVISMVMACRSARVRGWSDQPAVARDVVTVQAGTKPLVAADMVAVQAVELEGRRYVVFTARAGIAVIPDGP